jgi:hypothetical protein
VSKPEYGVEGKSFWSKLFLQTRDSRKLFFNTRDKAATLTFISAGCLQNIVY